MKNLLSSHRLRGRSPRQANRPGIRGFSKRCVTVAPFLLQATVFLLLACVAQDAALAQQTTEAQPTEQVQKPKSACDNPIQSIDQRKLISDRDRTVADTIARMLGEMNLCLGEKGSKADQQLKSAITASAKQYEEAAKNVANKHRSGISGTQAQSFDPIQTNKNNPQSSSMNPTNGVQATSTVLSPQSDRPIDAKQRVTATAMDIGRRIAENKVPLDSYAKTLYEAYQSETDPILKAALAKELDNYLNTIGQ